LGYDDRGKVKLSMRVVDQQTGADLEKAPATEPAATAE
jgi:polyribonucleotide nucleotidyltransferase